MRQMTTRGRLCAGLGALVMVAGAVVAGLVFAPRSARPHTAGGSLPSGGGLPAGASGGEYVPFVTPRPGADAAPSSAAAAGAAPSCGRTWSLDDIPSAVPVLDAGAWPPPPLTAQAAVAIDAETGAVLYGLNEHERRAPASTTKIMTAILALETVDQATWTVSETDAREMPGSSVMGLRRGLYITMRDLLFGLMLPSGNDAAIEIAKNVDGTVEAFVQRMNDKAAQIGLRNTHFDNPHGLDDRQHYSSAYDLAMLGRYAMGNEAFRTIAATQWHQLAPPSDYGLRNGNSLLGSYAGAEGIKIGWTNRAGWTFVASAVQEGHRVIVALLNSEDRDGDATALLDWSYGTHSWAEISPEMAQALLRARQSFATPPTASSEPAAQACG